MGMSGLGLLANGQPPHFSIHSLVQMPFEYKWNVVHVDCSEIEMEAFLDLQMAYLKRNSQHVPCMVCIPRLEPHMMHYVLYKCNSATCKSQAKESACEWFVRTLTCENSKRCHVAQHGHHLSVLRSPPKPDLDLTMKRFIREKTEAKFSMIDTFGLDDTTGLLTRVQRYSLRYRITRLADTNMDDKNKAHKAHKAMGSWRASYSYASDASTAVDDTTDLPQWMLFVRQLDAHAFVFTAVVKEAEKAVGASEDAPKFDVYELRLDTEGIQLHIEELGIEVDITAFVQLVLTTLKTRKCIDVVVEGSEAAVDVLLTYKFSETISRKGCIQLQQIATQLPIQVVSLLLDLHSFRNESVLTDLQKLQHTTKLKTQRPTSTTTSSISSTLGSFPSDPSRTDNLFSEESPATSVPKVNPQLLKRRHVPTGTARRKGPKGAKLAKSG